MLLTIFIIFQSQHKLIGSCRHIILAVLERNKLGTCGHTSYASQNLEYALLCQVYGLVSYSCNLTIINNNWSSIMSMFPLSLSMFVCVFCGCFQHRIHVQQGMYRLQCIVVLQFVVAWICYLDLFVLKSFRRLALHVLLQSISKWRKDVSCVWS